MSLELDSMNQKPAGESASAAAAARMTPQGTYSVPDDTVIILPVRRMVLFPGMILPVALGREASIAAAQGAAKAKQPIGVLLQRNAETEKPGPEELCLVGTVANIVRYVTTPDGTHHVICQGQQRFRVVEYLQGYPFMVARIGRIEDPEGAGKEIEARFVQLKERALQVLELLPQAPQELIAGIQSISSPGALADLVAGVMDIEVAEKQALLETVDLQKRLDGVLEHLAHRLQVLKLSREIDERTKASLDDTQRKYLLREQMKSIQKELGEGDEGQAAELEELKKAIAEAGMPEEVEK
ncbi:MAG TPA: LON peptidase substrate-binding domain-containing protein, partial [Burkholderiales bacterium]|nr:LON peptidase substrate-binding domain-containing protein [Burkholderiales bacterium]